MVYEVRTYTLRPGTVAEFEERFAKRKTLREKHSKLGAFWHTDFGPLNQVIHAWPYENLQHRTTVRDAMAKGARVFGRTNVSGIHAWHLRRDEGWTRLHWRASRLAARLVRARLRRQWNHILHARR